MKFGQMPDESPKIATYKAKWDVKYRKKWGIRNTFAEDLPQETVERIEKTCKKIYRSLLIRGYARLDLRLTAEGKIVFLEANPNPILAEDEDFAESAKQSGLTYKELIGRIIGLSKKDS
jgi:D-alanine-D-alanine ligase